MDDLEFSTEIRPAIKAGNVDHVIEMLKANPVRLNMLTPFGTWLHIAARNGKLEVVRALVELGADVNKPGGTFESGPLNLAVSYGHPEVVRYLLAQGAEFDLSEPFRNPLFGAIYHGNLAMVKLLVEHGIDTRIKYTGEIMKDTDAIAYACQREQFEIAAYLKSLTPSEAAKAAQPGATDNPDDAQ